MSATALPPPARPPANDSSPTEDARAWHALSEEETYAALRTDGEHGLTSAEATERLERLGRNELAEGPRRNWTAMLADQFRESLSYLFGRYWPETWTNNNPSYIGDGAYGFHPFHSGRWYESFPSGHTARTVAAAAVAWLAYPRWRWACVLATAAVAVSLIGMNYHFVSDVVAGGFVGGIVGVYAVHFFGIADPRHPSS